MTSEPPPRGPGEKALGHDRKPLRIENEPEHKALRGPERHPVSSSG